MHETALFRHPADQIDAHRDSRFACTTDASEVCDGVDRLFIDLRDEVARLEFGSGSEGARRDVGHQKTSFAGDARAPSRSIHRKFHRRARVRSGVLAEAVDSGLIGLDDVADVEAGRVHGGAFRDRVETDSNFAFHPSAIRGSGREGCGRRRQEQQSREVPHMAIVDHTRGDVVAAMGRMAVAARGMGVTSALCSY